MGDNTPSLIQRLLQRLRPREAYCEDESEWCRRIILATRRVQQVHLSLMGEFDSVRDVKSHLTEARPGIERLEQSLGRSQHLFEAFEESLRKHEEILMESAGARGAGLEQQDHARCLDEIARLVHTKDQLIQTLRVQLTSAGSGDPGSVPESGRVAELEEEVRVLRESAARDEHLASDLEDAGGRMEVRIDEMTELVSELEHAVGAGRSKQESSGEHHAREFAESAARIMELEEQLQSLQARSEAPGEHARTAGEALGEQLRTLAAQAERRDLETTHLEEECVSLQKDILTLVESRETELGDLRERMRLSEMARIQAETRHTEDITQFADHSRQRQEKLMGEIETLRGSLGDAKRECDSLATLAEDKERQVFDLRNSQTEICARNAVLEHAAETLEAMQALLQSKGPAVEERAAGLTHLMGADGSGGDEIESSKQPEAGVSPVSPGSTGHTGSTKESVHLDAPIEDAGKDEAGSPRDG